LAYNANLIMKLVAHIQFVQRNAIVAHSFDPALPRRKPRAPSLSRPVNLKPPIFRPIRSASRSMVVMPSNTGSVKTGPKSLWLWHIVQVSSVKTNECLHTCLYSTNRTILVSLNVETLPFHSPDVETMELKRIVVNVSSKYLDR